MASYPASVKTFTTKLNGDTIQPAHVNDLQDEVVAIEQDILTNGLTLTSGKIKFPATQSASADANTLDDYEEGTWTPVLSFGGSSAGITYSVQAGFYTKIGRMVFVDGRIALTSNGTGTGAAIISGLPFSGAGTSVGSSLDFSIAGAALTNPHCLVNADTVILAQTTAHVRAALTEANILDTSDFRFSLAFWV